MDLEKGGARGGAPTAARERRGARGALAGVRARGPLAQAPGGVHGGAHEAADGPGVQLP